MKYNLIMYRSDVASKSSNFRYSQVKQIISCLNPHNTLTLLAPSGFGKSILLRYLAFNNKYRRRFRKLRKIYFAYIDVYEIHEKILSNSEFLKSNPLLSTENLQILNNILLNSIKSNVPYEIVGTENDLIQFLTILFEVDKHNKVFLILDGVDKIFGQEFNIVREHLRFLRNNFRGRLNYIFSLGDLKSLDNLNYKSIGDFSSLISEKFIYLKLIPFAKEIYEMMFDQNVFSLYYNMFFNKELHIKFSILNKLTGGYPPYLKLLINENIDSLKEIRLTKELAAASNRLLNSIPKKQKDILIMIANNQKVDMCEDLHQLMIFGLVKVVGSNLKLFSEIMERYLKN